MADKEQKILREGLVDAKTSVTERTTELDGPFYQFRAVYTDSEDFNNAIELL